MAKFIDLCILASLIAFVCMSFTKADTEIIINPKYNNILGKINSNSNLSFFWDEPRYTEILQLPQDLLDTFIIKRKPNYINFDADLLYIKMARDEAFTYAIYIDFEYSSERFRKCIISKDSNDDIRQGKICRDNLLTCLSQKDVSDLVSSDFTRCNDKSKECSVIRSLDKGKIIPIIYCEKLYGRKL